MKHQIILGMLLVTLGACTKKDSSIEAITHFDRAVALALEEKFNEAVNAIDQAIKHSPRHKLKAYKAMLLAQAGRSAESIALFEQILADKTTPSLLRGDISNNYAGVLLANGKEQQARTIWERLTQEKNYLSPELAHANLGILALRNNQLKEAQKQFQKSVEIAPQYTDAYFYLGITCSKLEEWLQARDAMQHTIALAPQHAPAHDALKTINEKISTLRLADGFDLIES